MHEAPIMHTLFSLHLFAPAYPQDCLFSHTNSVLPHTKRMCAKTLLRNVVIKGWLLETIYTVEASGTFEIIKESMDHILRIKALIK